MNIGQEIKLSETKLKENIDDVCLGGVCARPSSIAKEASPEVEIVGQGIFKDRCSELGKLTDQLYNQKNLPNKESRQGTHQNDHANILKNYFQRLNSSNTASKHSGGNTFQHDDPPSTFPVNDTKRKYYSVLCGLAHSQWKCFPAVKFLKTSVTYGSLGESVEPNGHADNFFIAAICHNFFEDEHPRRSKKHYFYPKVGLCFPICKDEHWFVFIVDLKNKLFAFLDSIYDENHSFQIDARSNLINAFKE
ncbi:unnamed protein product [Urochloa humidicola]